MRNGVRFRYLPGAAALLLGVGLVGCGGGLHPVEGKVAYDDGTALTWGTVVFEMKEGDKKSMSRGDIQSDGTYKLGTNAPGDGAYPGKYRVLVTTPATGEAKATGVRDREVRGPMVDARYGDFNTSGLEFEVRPGRNEYSITVKRPGGRAK